MGQDHEDLHVSRGECVRLFFVASVRKQKHSGNRREGMQMLLSVFVRGIAASLLF